jgi:hypothetical protein
MEPNRTQSEQIVVVKRKVFLWKRLLLVITCPIWCVPYLFCCLIKYLIEDICEEIGINKQWFYKEIEEETKVDHERKETKN